MCVCKGPVAAGEASTVSGCGEQTNGREQAPSRLGVTQL